MAKALWKGRIRFADVGLPVKLYAAVREQRVRFHPIHEQDAARRHGETVHPCEHEIVEPENRIRAFEIEKEQDVPVPDEDLHFFEPEPGRDISVTQFVSAGSISPRLLGRTYALEPDGAEGAFAVLYAALARTYSAGLFQWTMRRRAFWGAVMARDTLLLCVLRMAAGTAPAATPKDSSRLRRQSMQRISLNPRI